MNNKINHNSNFDGILFDIDGTLISTLSLIYDTFRFVANKYLDRSFTDKEIGEMFGPTEDFILEKLMGDEFENARKDYYEFYEKNHDELTNNIEGLNVLIHKIKKSGIYLGIFTGKGRESSLITLRKLGLLELFDMIVTGDDVKEHKPSPEGILKFINQYNLKADKVLMIGDASVDIIASKEAGCKMASAMWDCFDRDKVLKLGSDYYVETTEELESVIFNNHKALN